MMMNITECNTEKKKGNTPSISDISSMSFEREAKTINYTQPKSTKLQLSDSQLILEYQNPIQFQADFRYLSVCAVGFGEFVSGVS